MKPEDYGPINPIVWRVNGLLVRACVDGPVGALFLKYIFVDVVQDRVCWEVIIGNENRNPCFF